MKAQIACLSLCLSPTGMLASTAAHAAQPPFVTVDHSSETLMDKATAKKLWADHLSPKIAKLYPPRKWGFLSEVEGGFTDSKLCVVTARAMLMPRAGKSLTFSPAKTATTFDSVPNATMSQCRDLAKTKLDEAIVSMLASLAAS